VVPESFHGQRCGELETCRGPTVHWWCPHLAVVDTSESDRDLPEIGAVTKPYYLVADALPRID